MTRFAQNHKDYKPTNEDILQAKCWMWACNAYGLYRLLCHVPNQAGTRHPLEVQQLKAMGVTPGVHDLFLYWLGQLYWLECKFGKNTQSDDQEKFGVRMTEQGAICYEFRTFEKFQEIITQIVNNKQMIKLQVIGHLGKDATTNTVNGKPVINFSVAHSEKYKNAQGEAQEKTTWVECAYWSDNKVGPYLKKGVQVYVEGNPEVRTYPKADGSTGTSLSLRVGLVQLLGGGEKGQASQPATQTAPQTQTADEDLPF